MLLSKQDSLQRTGYEEENIHQEETVQADYFLYECFFGVFRIKDDFSTAHCKNLQSKERSIYCININKKLSYFINTFRLFPDFSKQN